MKSPLYVQRHDRWSTGGREPGPRSSTRARRDRSDIEAALLLRQVALRANTEWGGFVGLRNAPTVVHIEDKAPKDRGALHNTIAPLER